MFDELMELLILVYKLRNDVRWLVLDRARSLRLAQGLGRVCLCLLTLAPQKVTRTIRHLFVLYLHSSLRCIPLQVAIQIELILLNMYLLLAPSLAHKLFLPSVDTHVPPKHLL